MGGRQSKVDKYGMQEVCKDLYEQGKDFESIAKELTARGCLISATSVERWLKKQPGYVPRSTMKVELTELNPDCLFNKEELTPFLINIPEFANSEDRTNWTVENLESLLTITMAVCNQKAREHAAGKRMFPYDEIKALKTIIDISGNITKQSKARAGHALDVKSALAKPNIPEWDELTMPHTE